MKNEKGWFGSLLGYAGKSRSTLAGSVILSLVSEICGIFPFYCMYRLIDAFVQDTVTNSLVYRWCAAALAAYAVKVLCFGLSTGLSHLAAFDVLAGLRKRVTDRFMHAPLGKVQEHSIGEIKNIIVDKIESMEPPLAHMVPEGAGHILLPLVSIISLLLIDPRLALSSLVTFPAAIICMGLTFKISGRNFDIYNRSNAYMNSTIVEYIEGIEVIKAFGRAGVSYEKYADAITDYKKFVTKWLSSTWITMNLAFALFPSTMVGASNPGILL